MMSDPTIPRRPALVLGHLLTVAHWVLEKPYSAFGHKDTINSLLAEIDEQLKRPAEEDVRFIDETAKWLAQALRNVADAPGPVKGGPRDRWVEIALYLKSCVHEREQAALAAQLVPATSEGGGGARR